MFYTNLKNVIQIYKPRQFLLLTWYTNTWPIIADKVDEN